MGKKELKEKWALNYKADERKLFAGLGSIMNATFWSAKKWARTWSALPSSIIQDSYWYSTGRKEMIGHFVLLSIPHSGHIDPCQQCPEVVCIIPFSCTDLDKFLLSIFRPLKVYEENLINAPTESFCQPPNLENITKWCCQSSPGASSINQWKPTEDRSSAVQR